MKRAATTLWAAVFLLGGNAAAQDVQNDELLCRADQPRLDKYSYLRALSLDLRGRLPTMQEYAELDSVGDVSEAVIDSMLASEGFVERAVRRHRALLWNNVSNVTLLNYRTSLRTSSGLYWRTRPALLYRGDFVPCRNEPAAFDANGQIQVVVDAQGIRREGYVEVNPYWDPTTTIRVCAFDAQDTLFTSRGVDCATNAGFNDPECGCGPGLRTCRFGYYSDARITESMAEDVDRRIAAVVRENRPYTELFTSRRAFMNGHLAHFLKYQTGVPAGARMRPIPYDMELLPDLDYARDGYYWVEIELGPGHAGVLTSPAYLLRFQTNRARASRFFEAFLCQPFSPPRGGLPAVDPNTLPHPDLQQREGCKYCHALLEPAAAHWGRWTERGAGYLDPSVFPASRDDCRTCGTTGQLCSADCRNYYITRTLSSEEEPFIGMLTAFQFLRESHQRNVGAGPNLLLNGAVVDDRFPTCTARRALEGFLGRELSADEEAQMQTLAHRFVGSDFNYRELVKAVVMSSVYRRVR